jgi:hypothetical protein
MNAYKPMTPHQQSSFHDFSFRLLFGLWILSVVVLYIVRAVVEESVLRPLIALLFSGLISCGILVVFMFTFNFLLAFRLVNTFVINTVLILCIILNVALMRMDAVYNTPEQRFREKMDQDMKQEIKDGTEWSRQIDKARRERKQQEARDFPYPWERTGN